jgi:hypothetical protein
MFPSVAIWNTAIDTAPLHRLNGQWVNNSHGGHSFHRDFGWLYRGRLSGIPINFVAGNSVSKVVVKVGAYAKESDIVPPEGLPIPTNVVIEGDTDAGPGVEEPGSDQHCLILDTDTNILHEFYHMSRVGDGTYLARQYSRWNTSSLALRTEGWASTDAAGLPVAPLMVRYDEVLAAVHSGGCVPHAFRFTLDLTWKPHLWPARHDAPSGYEQCPPMGARVRLKANVDIGYLSPINQAIARTLKKYGMILADNGGDWFIQGVPDRRWADADLSLLNVLPKDAFEWVDTSGWMESPNSMKSAQEK